MVGSDVIGESLDGDGSGGLEDFLMMALPSGVPSTGGSCGTGQTMPFHSPTGFSQSHQHPTHSSSASGVNAAASAPSLMANKRCYWCHLCKREFPFPSKLNEHMRTHTGEKPFACPFCPFRTSLKWNLKSHMTRHQDVLPKHKSVT